jgi:dienelactone hydrolase
MGSASDAPVLDGYAVEDFAADGATHAVYRKGSGPAVIVMAEIPGITPKVVEFADRVADAGFTAVVPWLFGTPGKSVTALYGLQSMAYACVSREFTMLAKGKASPVTDWLRALGRREHERCGGPGIGAVGMCITGGFALAMAVDDTLLAPVLSQPSLPFAAALFKRNATELGISPEGLARVKERCATDDLCVLGLRFTGDPLVPAARFDRLREVLGDHFVGVDIDSSSGNPHGNPRGAHSVLTEHLVDDEGHPTHDALRQVLDLFRTKLQPA